MAGKCSVVSYNRAGFVGFATLDEKYLRTSQYVIQALIYLATRQRGEKGLSRDLAHRLIGYPVIGWLVCAVQSTAIFASAGYPCVVFR